MNTKNNFRFKFDYCQNSNRIRFTTTLDSNLIDDMQHIKDKTKIDMSKQIETVMSYFLNNQERFNQFLQLCKEYDGYNK